MTGEDSLHRDTLPAHAVPRVSSLMRYLPLVFVLLAACAAPPTHNQVTSQAVKRNCEARGEAAANEVRKENTQIVKEGGATNSDDMDDIESRAMKVQRETFKSCMLKYAV